MSTTKTRNKLKYLESVTIPASGTELIKNAKDMFKYIDRDFVGYGASQIQNETPESKLDIYEMVEDATLTQIFNTETDVMTQGQILEFVKNHKDKLRTDGYATFFLFKSNKNFFVADVGFGGDGTLGVDVDRLEGGLVYGASYRHRVVIPNNEKEETPDTTPVTANGSLDLPSKKQ